MKHLELFENFNSHQLHNFRVKLVKSGMGPGKYLFTMVEESSSYWGLFDLEGLKNIEDDINTYCIIEELKGKLYPDWEQTNLDFLIKEGIVVTEVPTDHKFIVLLNTNLFPKSEIKKFFTIADANSGTGYEVKGGNKLGSFGEYSVISVNSKDNIPKLNFDYSPEFEDEIMMVFPADTNNLYYAGNHFSGYEDVYSRKENPDEMKNFSILDSLEDFEFIRSESDMDRVQHTPIKFEEIEPYMSSIIDGGITKKFLKIVDGMMKNPKKPWEVVTKKNPTFSEILNPDNDPQIDKFFKDTDILNIMQVEMSKPYRSNKKEGLSISNKMEYLLDEWEERLPKQFVEFIRGQLGIFKWNNGLY